MGTKAMSSHGSGALPREGSVCSLTFSEVDEQLHGVDDLLRSAASKKTVEEVWRDIQGGCPRAQMTLEDFLCRAADAGERGWAQQLGHHHPAVGRPVPRPLGVGAGPVLDALYHDGHEAGLKRGVAERPNDDQRKKRMIKNRESAARSRARKQVSGLLPFPLAMSNAGCSFLSLAIDETQAYTNELENKVEWLEEENKRLEEENSRLRRHKVRTPCVAANFRVRLNLC
jgi:ABA responsive element binding factor